MTHPVTQSDQQTVVRRSFKRVAYYDPVIPTDLLEALWRCPEAFVDRGERMRWKIRRTVLVEWSSQKYVFKHQVEQSRRHALARLIQPARAQATWKFTRRLEAAGIATPHPVACIENRWGKFRRDSFLMYSYVPGITLKALFDQEANQSRWECGGLWQQLDKLRERVLRLRISLPDMNPGNFVVCPAGRLWLIDLDKARFQRVFHRVPSYQLRKWSWLLERAAVYEVVNGIRRAA